MPIKGVTDQHRMPRLGKIHLGIKKANAAGKEYPTKTDYFVCPEAIQEVYGPEPRELDILFPIEFEENFASTWFRAYSYSRGLVCKGDGETARRMVDTTLFNPDSQDVNDNPLPNRNAKPENLQHVQVHCSGVDCPDWQSGACRQMMMLQFMLPRVPGLGIWQIDTTSWNGIKNVMGGIELVRAMCGQVSMIPLKLQLLPMEVTPQASGRRDTVYVLGLSADFSTIDVTKKRLKDAPMRTSNMLPEPDDEVPDDLILDNESVVDPETGEIIDEDIVKAPEKPAQRSRSQAKVISPEVPIKPSTASLAALWSFNQLREAYNISVDQVAAWVSENYEGKGLRELTDDQIDFVKATIQNGGTFTADLKPQDDAAQQEEQAELLP